MKRKQMRIIFGLTVLATFAIIGLQVYIWQQGMQQERDRLSRGLRHAVYEAAEEFMRPLEFNIRVAHASSIGDTVKVRRPGLIALQIGTVDSTIELNHSNMDSLHGHMTKLATRVRERVGVDTVESIEENSFAFVTTDTTLNDWIVRHDEACIDCLRSVSELSSENFRPLLETELTRLDIDTDFQWGIRHLDHWLIVDGDSSLLQASNWQYPFFSFPVGTMQHTIEMVASQEQVDVDQVTANTAFLPPTIFLHVPAENWYLLRNIGPTLLMSTLLSLLVFGCIGYALRVILNQKQLSEVKTDFINNMTHELKTPISTISLAVEALQDEGIDLDEPAQQRYLSMIAAENDRLATQVEKVLQMALLDKKDLGLKFEPVRMHEVLDDTLDVFSLQMKERKGTITLALEASRDLVVGDVLHLRQMVSNLLDNAIKYSPGAPDIKLETQAKEAGIEIGIHDKGMGISRDALRKVFDRFYRVPTGNRHDVKGFGLGLSYVHTMALAHGGHVRATSKPGAGSSFYLYLPFADA